MALRFKVESAVARREDVLASSAELHRITDEIPADIRNLEAISTAIDDLDACTHAIENFGMSAVSVMNAHHQFDDIVRKFNKATTSAQAMEGFIDGAKELGTKFIDAIKRLIDKIILWIKTFINKIRSSTPALNRTSTVKTLSKAGITSEQAEKATSGGMAGNAVFGKGMVAAISAAVQKISQCTSALSKVQSLKTNTGKLDFTTGEALDVAMDISFDHVVEYDSSAKKILWDGAAEHHGLFFIDHEDRKVNLFASTRAYRTNGFDGAWFTDDADANDQNGCDFDQIESLERSLKTLFTNLVTFETASEHYLKQLRSKVEVENDVDKKGAYTELVKCMSVATTSNGSFWATLNHIIVDMLDAYEKKVLSVADKASAPEGLDSISEDYIKRANAASETGDSKTVADMCFMILMKDGDPNKQTCLKFADWVASKFKKNGHELYEADDGRRTDPNGIDPKALCAARLRSNFSRERLVEFYSLAKGEGAAATNTQPTGIRIKSDLDALVKEGDVAKARAYVISLIDSNDTLPWILRAGDFLNKNIDGGIYDSESGINMDWDIDYLKGVLKRQFRRGVLQRILQLFSKNDGQTSATKTTNWEEIKTKLDELVSKGNKIDAKVFIIGMADKSRSAMTPFILKAADYLNENLEGGLYDEEVEIDQSYDMNYCKAALRMDFTRGYISRILQLFQENQKKGTN